MRVRLTNAITLNCNDRLERSANRSRWQFREEDGIVYVKAPLIQADEPSVLTESIRDEYRA